MTNISKERLPGLQFTSDQLRRELDLMYQQGRFTEAKLPHETIRALLDSWDALTEVRRELQVPREPTEAMLKSSIPVLGGGHINLDVVRDVYRAMIAAARRTRGL